MKNILISICLFISSISYSQRMIGDSLMCFTKPEIIRIGMSINDLKDSISLQQNIIQEKDYQISVYNDIVLRDTAIINQYSDQIYKSRNVIQQQNLYIGKLKTRGIEATIGGLIFGFITALLIVR